MSSSKSFDQQKFEDMYDLFSIFGDFGAVMDEIRAEDKPLDVSNPLYGEILKVGVELYKIGGKNALLAAASSYGNLPTPNLRAIALLDEPWSEFGNWQT